MMNGNLLGSRNGIETNTTQEKRPLELENLWNARA
jgi:hypothetical protein